MSEQDIESSEFGYSNNLIYISDNQALVLAHLITMCASGRHIWLGTCRHIVEASGLHKSTVANVLKQLVKLDLIVATREPSGGFGRFYVPTCLLSDESSKRLTD